MGSFSLHNLIGGEHMPDDRYLINIIIEYLENVPEPTPSWPRRDFAKASYTRWAIEEIIREITKHTNWSVMRCVEDFKYRVGKYALKSVKHDEVSEIFRVAYDAACDVSDILYAMMP